MKFDPKITKAVQDWLNTPEPERDIKAGADLMLSLNRNRALYNSIMRRPDKFLPKLVYELKKHLKMRLDNMAVADVVRFEALVMPSVRLTIDNHVEISSEDELPEGTVAKGRRADHDSLPEDIRQLWDSNADRYRKIIILFNELKAMHDAQPCDRYEKLVILDELDKTYRANLEKYDKFVMPEPLPETGEVPAEPSSETISAPDGPDEATAGNEKIVNNARKTLSKYRKQLSALGPDDPKRQTALDKIQAAVNAITGAGAGMADETKSELVALGIRVD